MSTTSAVAAAPKSEKGLYSCLVSVSVNRPKQPVIVLDADKITVGRSPDVDVCLRSTIISRKHAIFSKSSDAKSEWTIEDNNSMNGIYINSVKIPCATPVILQDGNIIQFGVSIQKNSEAEFIYKYCKERSIKNRNELKRKREPMNDNAANKIFKSPEKVSIATHKLNDSSQKTKQSEIVIEGSDGEETSVDCAKISKKREPSCSATLSRTADIIQSYSKTSNRQGPSSSATSSSIFLNQLLKPDIPKAHGMPTDLPHLTTATTVVKKSRTRIKSTKLHKNTIGFSLTSTTPVENSTVTEMKRLLKENEDKLKILASSIENERASKEKMEKELTSTLDNERALKEKREKEMLEMKKKQEKLFKKYEKKKESAKASKSKKKSKKDPEKGKGDDSVLNVMENEFTCSICSEMFFKATTLNCSHSFCEYCINQWIKKKKECPICRCPVESTIRSIALDNFIGEMMKKNEDLQKNRQAFIEERKVEEEKAGPISQLHPPASLQEWGSFVASEILGDGNTDDDSDDFEIEELCDSDQTDDDDHDVFLRMTPW